ncbi:MAG TPA: hypothetical protein PKA29_02125 [Candidatus Saccharibacteria bacterium]|nr:hypothetical protein [Candidatus Saccharibacteria bacterium]
MEPFFIIMSSAGVGMWLYNVFMRSNGDSKTAGIGAGICVVIVAFIEFMILRAIS